MCFCSSSTLPAALSCKALQKEEHRRDAHDKQLHLLSQVGKLKFAKRRASTVAHRTSMLLHINSKKQIVNTNSINSCNTASICNARRTIATVTPVEECKTHHNVKVQNNEQTSRVSEQSNVNIHLPQEEEINQQYQEKQQHEEEECCEQEEEYNDVSSHHCNINDGISKNNDEGKNSSNSYVDNANCVAGNYNDACDNENDFDEDENDVDSLIEDAEKELKVLYGPHAKFVLHKLSHVPRSSRLEQEEMEEEEYDEEHENQPNKQNQSMLSNEAHNMESNTNTNTLAKAKNKTNEDSIASNDHHNEVNANENISIAENANDTQQTEIDHDDNNIMNSDDNETKPESNAYYYRASITFRLLGFPVELATAKGKNAVTTIHQCLEQAINSDVDYIAGGMSMNDKPTHYHQTYHSNQTRSNRRNHTRHRRGGYKGKESHDNKSHSHYRNNNNKQQHVELSPLQLELKAVMDELRELCVDLSRKLKFSIKRPVGASVSLLTGLRKQDEERRQELALGGKMNVDETGCVIDSVEEANTNNNNREIAEGGSNNDIIHNVHSSEHEQNKLFGISSVEEL